MVLFVIDVRANQRVGIVNLTYICENNKHMEKIRIQNIKTGQVSEITKMAWDLLKKGGRSKVFDVIPTQNEPVKFVVPVEETTIVETIVESPIAEEPQTEFVDIDQPTAEETNEESAPKKRGPKSNK